MSDKDIIYREDAIRIAEQGQIQGFEWQIKKLLGIPSAEPERHYCRECKWSRCHINLDKYGRSKTYWHCLWWGSGTHEEGFCHEWERRTDNEN